MLDHPGRRLVVVYMYKIMPPARGYPFDPAMADGHCTSALALLSGDPASTGPQAMPQAGAWLCNNHTHPMRTKQTDRKDLTLAAVSVHASR